MRERLGSDAAEAAAGAGNQDGLGHDEILSLDQEEETGVDPDTL